VYNSSMLFDEKIASLYYHYHHSFQHQLVMFLMVCNCFQHIDEYDLSKIKIRKKRIEKKHQRYIRTSNISLSSLSFANSFNCRTIFS
jgi:hypothetical protein